MNIEIRPANTATEAEALAALDARIFLPSDCFENPQVWKEYETFWIFLDSKIIGSIALGLNLEFETSEINKPSHGCLYIASTGILPDFQRCGIGNVVKRWEINYAKSHGFTRISTHCRKSNSGSLRLNQKFGFTVIDEVPNYYQNPDEPTIVMELRLDEK